MKILCFSDLHQASPMNKYGNLSPEAQQCVEVYNRIQPNVVVIAGDIYESNVPASLIYKDLSSLFPDVPVVCCLGNHEFFFRSVYTTLLDYKKHYKPKKYNVHYLDVVDYYDIDSVRFLGNVLWYDGSMSTVKDQDLQSFANRRWMDCMIREFDFVKECKRNIKNITENIAITNMTNVLLTHCVPHHTLNGHMIKEKSEINAYSGVYGLLDKIKVQYSISGHTHWELEKTINGCKGFNIGNDYYCGGNDLKYKLIEVKNAVH